MSTCNHLDLQTLGGSQPVMPKNLSDHWAKVIALLLLQISLPASFQAKTSLLLSDLNNSLTYIHTHTHIYIN